MKINRKIQVLLFWALILCFSCGGGKKADFQDGGISTKKKTPFMEGESKDLIASVADLQNNENLMNLLKFMDEFYTDGSIKINTYPFPRSIQNVMTYKADFHVPSMRNPDISEDNLPFRTVTESIKPVIFVCYSNVDNIVMIKDLIEAHNKGGDFPYTIDGPGGLENLFPVPITPSRGIKSSLQKLQNKRIDALFWAQEEADPLLKELKLNKIYRSHLADYESVIMIAKGPASDKLDALLSETLKKLKEEGMKAGEYGFDNLILSYQDWQPSEMGWE